MKWLLKKGELSMKIIKVSLLGALVAMPLFALSDYRCTEKNLCEIEAYKEVDSIDEAFAEGKAEGNIRLAYIDQDNHAAGAADTYGTSIGGQLKYETAKFNSVSLAAAAFVSQKISPLSGDKDKGELNGDFFGTDGDSFAYLGEAYVDYGYENFDLRLGRQKLDTPLNDRDDIRMLPNTFEALMAGYGGITDTILVAGYINRWAGYDSGDDISMFKDMPGGLDADGKAIKGVFLAGVMNESIENVELQAWYYDFDKTAGVLYTEAVYTAEYRSGLGVEAGIQYANYSEKSASAIEGDVYGGVISLGFEGVAFGVACNRVDAADGKSMILGYGGGPYFTSMEEWTIDGMNDGEAYVLGVEVDFSKMLLEGLGLAYAYGKFNGNEQTTADASKVEEHDLILSYAFAENTDLEVSYADVADKTNSGVNDTGYDRILARFNYYF